MSKSRTMDRILPSRNHPFNWYLFPGLIFYLLFMIVPLTLIFKESIWHNGITLVFYQQVFQDTAYTAILLNTIRISLLVTLICLVFSYPFALLLYSSRGKTSRILYLIFSIPLIVNPLALLYAWMVILQKEGVVNFFAVQILKVAHVPFQLIYNATGVILGMTYLLIPYSILMTYASIASIDGNLIKAALNLGSSRLQVFTKIVLPLSLAGSLSGAVIVFALAMGYFVTPALLGGLEETMLSMVIADRMNMPGGWGIASALTVFLLSTMAFLFLVTLRLVKNTELWRIYFSGRLSK